MIIVSDTSILSGLLLIDRFELLGDIYHEVIIPQVVLNELLVLKDFGYEVETIQKATWLKIAEPSDKDLVEKLKSVLDNGESAAIALSLELKPVMDELREKAGFRISQKLYAGIGTGW